MIIREYSLPAGWYPRDPQEIVSFLKGFTPKEPFSRAVIAPHAGWYYSGRIAALAVSKLDPQAETLVVLGGHLSEGYPFLFAMEDAVKTPFGPMPIDTDFRSALIKELDLISPKGCADDRHRDNTVEVLLPMVRHFFPKAAVIWLRLPAETASFEAGKTIAKAAAKLNRRVNVIASTDLTHYGDNYNFSPQGSGEAALRWVRDVNDVNFIKAVEAGDIEQVLRRAQCDNSACAAGAVVGVMGFAAAQGLPAARLLEYATSADIGEGGGVPDSFVGYAAVAF